MKHLELLNLSELIEIEGCAHYDSCGTDKKSGCGEVDVCSETDYTAIPDAECQQ